MKRTLVGEVMTTPVVTAGEPMPFRHLVALLYASGIGAVPVIDPEGRVLGVVSNADLMAKAGGLPAAPRGDSRGRGTDFGPGAARDRGPGWCARVA
jgi:CBS domain-containing protein